MKKEERGAGWGGADLGECEGDGAPPAPGREDEAGDYLPSRRERVTAAFGARMGRTAGLKWWVCAGRLGLQNSSGWLGLQNSSGWPGLRGFKWPARIQLSGVGVSAGAIRNGPNCRGARYFGGGRKDSLLEIICPRSARPTSAEEIICSRKRHA